MYSVPFKDQNSSRTSLNEWMKAYIEMSLVLLVPRWSMATPRGSMSTSRTSNTANIRVSSAAVCCPQRVSFAGVQSFMAESSGGLLADCSSVGCLVTLVDC